MILITVGTERFPFNRLMQWLDSLIKQNFLQPNQEEIIIQSGSCTILPSGVKSFSVLPQSQFHDLVKKARLIIAHCGEGTIDLLAASSKPFILVPRSHRWGEHVDDHQLELAENLRETGVPIATSPEDLISFLASPQPVKLSMVPATYYFLACSLLEKRFSKDLRQEQLTPLVPASLRRLYRSQEKMVAKRYPKMSVPLLA